MALTKYEPRTIIEGHAVELDYGPLSLSDYNALKEAMIEGKSTDARNVLLCKMLFGTGLRIAEVLRLTPETIQSNGPETSILVRRGKKRGKAQWESLPLHPELGLALKSFAEANLTRLTDPIFKVKARQVENIFKAAGIRALGHQVQPHMLRKLYAKTLLDNGLPAPAAAKMLGHQDSRTTEQWYYDLTADQRREINRRMPI